VTGDSRQGIGPSGVGLAVIGHRLRVPAAGSRAAGSWTAGLRGRHPAPDNMPQPIIRSPVSLWLAAS